MTLPIGKKVELKIDGKTYQVEIKSLTAEGALVEVDGREVQVDINLPQDAPRAPAPRKAAAPAKPAAPRPAPASSKSLLSLMPGVVIKILVKEGQQVAAGDVLLVLEAMKMENEIRSDRSGTIGSIDVSAGQQVQTGDPLVSFA
ncbi:biotin/lipoyl-containing protein [Myxococcota bacterium]